MRALLLTSFLLLGCGSDDDNNSAGGAASQATLDDLCASSCAAQKKCSSTVDETTCVNRCKNDVARYNNKLRADYVTGWADCTKTASCDKLGDCDDTAKASISPTPVCQSVCDDLMKKNTECRFGNTDKSKCLDDLKAYSDATLEQVRACTPKACGEYAGCALSTIGL